MTHPQIETFLQEISVEPLPPSFVARVMRRVAPPVPAVVVRFQLQWSDVAIPTAVAIFCAILFFTAAVDWSAVPTRLAAWGVPSLPTLPPVSPLWVAGGLAAVLVQLALILGLLWSEEV